MHSNGSETGGVADELRKLAELRECVLTEEEEEEEEEFSRNRSATPPTTRWPRDALNRLHENMGGVRSPRVVCLIAVALLGAACTSGAAVSTTTSSPATSTTVSSHPHPTVAVDLSATPAGWISVAYGDAQVSVPALWAASYGNPCCAGQATGAVFVNPAGGPYAYPARMRGKPATVVTLERLPAHPAKSGRGVVTINGIAVRPAGVSMPKGIGMMPIYTYLVPSLGVQLTVSGTFGSRVLHTLTRSPRSIALASGSAPPVPSAWQAVTFRGLTLEAPRSWSVTPTAVTGRNVGSLCMTSGVSFITTQVALSTDRQPFPIAFCPAFLYQGLQPPKNGVEVDGGSDNRFPFPVALSFSKHCLDLYGLTACPATSPTYSILLLRVTGPSLPKPLLVSIGLAGNGMVARTILDSLRGA